jgi:hypothetical protein
MRHMGNSSINNRIYHFGSKRLYLFDITNYTVILTSIDFFETIPVNHVYPKILL